MKKISPILIVIAATLWGTMGLFTRKMTELGFSTLQLVFMRASLTATVLFLYLLIFDRDKLKIKLRDAWIFVLAGLVSVVLFQHCYTSAIMAGSISIAATLLYTAPIFVTIISAVLFKEKITPIKVTALITAFTGCILVSGITDSGTSITTTALFLGIASGFTYGLYSIFTKIGLRHYSPLTFTFYTFLIATIVLIPLCDVKPMITVAFSSATAAFMPAIFGIITSVIPYICFTCGLKYIDAGKANITATIEPAVATLIGILIFDEKLGISALAGIALVLISAVILNLPQKHSTDTSKY
ncbi:MAG: EamA family transporter [Clostridia bacterium]|nr:EamA family transporter [Clostridia bacterium]